MDEYSGLRWIDGYDCNDLQNEQRPDLEAYQPNFKELDKFMREAVDLLKDPIHKSTFENVMTKSLLDEAHRRTNERQSDQVIFAVVGEMASGKSSVINSILGIGTIAHKGDSGGSCTWVVQRFMKRFHNQASPFAAKVYFFNSDEIKAMLKALIAKYYRAMGKGASSDDEDESEDTPDDDISEKLTVIETMRPLFCEQAEFESVESAMKFLDNAESEDDQMMLEQLSIWADAVEDTHLKGNDFVQVDASTTHELIGRLQQYSCTTESEYGRGGSQPWPLVRMIDFGLNIPLLNDGVVLVDSPGTSDANSVRAANAKAQHAKCSHKIYVANVVRARDDKALRIAMTDSYKWRGTQNSIVVLTRGEEINLLTNAEGSELSKKMAQQLYEQIDGLQDRKKKLVSDRKMASLVERLSIDDELEKLCPKLEQLSQEYKLCRLKMRNEYTRFKFQEKYRQITGDKRPLPTYVVANGSWDVHQSGHHENERPIFTVEETGIPALRMKLYEMPAEGKLNDALHVVEHQLPRLINSFEMYCSKKYIARKSEIEALILQPMNEWPEIRQRAIERLKEEVKRVILQPMKDDEDRWAHEARQLCRDWGVKFYKKNLLMLKNEGFQAGRRKTDKDIDWNSELVKINENYLANCFKELWPLLKPCFSKTWREIGIAMEKAKDNISKDEEFNLMSLGNLIQTFNKERPYLGKAVEKSMRQLTNGATEIAEATVRDPRAGYLAKAMLPIYRNVQQIKGGRGSVKKRIREFERQVCKGSGVLIKVHDAIEDAFDKLFEQELSSLGGKLQKIFDSIKESFGLMCDDAVAKTPPERQNELLLINQLKKALIKAHELADGPIKELAEECKTYAAKNEEVSLFVPKG